MSIDWSLNCKILQKLIKVYIIFSFLEDKPNLVFKSCSDFLAANLCNPNNSFPQIILNFGRFQQLSEQKLSLDEVVTILGTTIEYVFDFIDDFSFDHEVIAIFGDTATLDHFLIDGVDGRLALVFEISDDGLDLRPCDLLLELVSIFKVEDDLFERYSPSNLWILDSWLVDKVPICVIVLYFEEKRFHGDSLVAKCVESTEDGLQFFPAFLAEDGLLCDLDGFVVKETSDRWSIDEEDIQKLQKSEPIAVFVC